MGLNRAFEDDGEGFPRALEKICSEKVEDDLGEAAVRFSLLFFKEQRKMYKKQSWIWKFQSLHGFKLNNKFFSAVHYIEVMDKFDIIEEECSRLSYLFNGEKIWKIKPIITAKVVAYYK
jgi:hypothetical protein